LAAFALRSARAAEQLDETTALERPLVVPKHLERGTVLGHGVVDARQFAFELLALGKLTVAWIAERQCVFGVLLLVVFRDR